MKTQKQKPSGFSRIELLTVIAAASLLLALAMIGGADNRGRSQKLVCMENLRQIGQGFELWRFEHADTMPWHLPTTNGGSRGLGVGAAWSQMTFLSNSIASPRTVVCPSDYKTLPHTATNWGSGPGGFQNSAYRNNATSYTIGLHSFLYAPQEYLSSDRNLSVDAQNANCGPTLLYSGVSYIYYYNGGSSAGWTNELHGLQGNLLLNDGSVGERTTKQFLETLRLTQDDNAVLHLLIP